jgi:hypothetical protein
MAKKKQQAAAETSLSDRERERAEIVLASQGRAKGLLDSFPVGMQRELASWCDASGNVKPGVREAVDELLANYYAELKATVEEEGPSASAES